METTQIRQGDQYPLQFRITDASGNVITNNAQVVSKVSITIGSKTKVWPNTGSGISYNSQTQCWEYPLTQSETFALSVNHYDALIRIKFVNNTILSTATAPLDVVGTIDRSTL